VTWFRFLAGAEMVAAVLASGAAAAQNDSSHSIPQAQVPAEVDESRLAAGEFPFGNTNADVATQWGKARAQPDQTQAPPETDGRAVEGNIAPRGVVFVTNDTGGLIADYAVRVAEARKSKTNVVISGRCQSACTIYTALVPDRLACASPGTTLEFHKPRNREGQSTDALDKLFLGFLSDEVKQYIATHGGLPATGFKVVAAERFVPPCVRP
jgi:hypothetical protein